MIDEKKIVKNIYSTIGKPIWGSRDSTKELGDHIGGMIIELKPSEERTIRTKELIKLWKGALPEMEGLRNLTIKERKRRPSRLGRRYKIIFKKCKPKRYENCC